MFRKFKSRSGISVTETVIAALLLSAALGAVLRFAVSAKSGLRNQELRTRLEWELVNAREKIGAWPEDKITEEAIATLPVSGALTRKLQELQWSAKITSIKSPVEALQVDLALHYEVQGRFAEPRSLSFWVPKQSKVGVSETSESSDPESTEPKSTTENSESKASAELNSNEASESEEESTSQDAASTENASTENISEEGSAKSGGQDE
ncbi:MAG: hypothetical protein AAF483_01415 [Planctomycetota bacterium]